VFLADAVLALHFAIAAFIVAGLPAVWIGHALGWRWVTHPWFRHAHLAAIVFVAAEAVAGIVCPLTVLEDALRGVHEPRTFVSRWIARLLFYEAPPWVFTTCYVTFAIATLVTLRMIPPRQRLRPG